MHKKYRCILSSSIRFTLVLLCIQIILTLFLSVADAAQAKRPKKKMDPSKNLFGTVEFRSKIKSLPSWVSVIERNKKNFIFDPGSKLNSKITWQEFRDKTLKLSKFEQLKAVNRFWNQWPYKTDNEVYRKPDYWAIPKEFRKNSGDCEDYSIAKFYTLLELGWDMKQLRIVVVMETIRRIAHAILAVYLDNKIYILDNLSPNVLEHTRYKNYVPQYSINHESRWVHVRPK